MPITGRCHCGEVTYTILGTPLRHTLCHCTDCRRWSGAPLVGWIAVPQARLQVQGPLSGYASSALATREFCPRCGTGLFYRNETWLPGLVDIQSGTLDDPARLPPEAHLMARERLPWMKTIGELPEYPGYPGA